MLYKIQNWINKTTQPTHFHKSSINYTQKYSQIEKPFHKKKNGLSHQNTVLLSPPDSHHPSCSADLQSSSSSVISYYSLNKIGPISWFWCKFSHRQVRYTLSSPETNTYISELGLYLHQGKVVVSIPSFRRETNNVRRRSGFPGLPPSCLTSGRSWVSSGGGDELRH